MPRFKGSSLQITADAALDLARQALASGQGNLGSCSYKTWFVDLDGQRVSPKWLLSLLTGVHVSKFVTDDARRVLVGLGIPVNHVEAGTDE